ncbi:MAG: UTRA domain-containing protein [Roseicyclus sp.]|nr:UTRA domain-containing protein [Roseicyclus sp.]MBO6624955.1 UTRA domain-containing protein [Roseicyclus sp.]MBO6921903.1 UTRA domain-containing protein [Roseicyclus sp.]
MNSWQEIHDEVLRRIHTRQWKPGDLIPNETDLAREFGCARATVNRALRTLAETGLLDRRRKAGTRVTLHPVGKAVIEIPLIRRDIEDRGARYGYRLISRQIGPAPPSIRAALRIETGTPLVHLLACHLADARPYLLEDRWINPAVVLGAETADFTRISANEWLLTHAPYTHGDLTIAAEPLPPQAAAALQVAAGEAGLVLTRTTWDHTAAVTTVRLSHRPGHLLHSAL